MSSITIREVLASDTVSAMVDKLNFNFDQLLLNGGGPVGPKGGIGGQGTIGPRGAIWFSALDLYILPAGTVKVNTPPIFTVVGDPNKFAPVDIASPYGVIGNISKPLRSGDFYIQEGDDNYLANPTLDGDVWEYNSVTNTWVFTGTNIKGSIGSAGIPGSTEWSRIANGLDDYIYTTELPARNVPKVIIGASDPIMSPLIDSVTATLTVLSDSSNISIGNKTLHSADANSAPTIFANGGGTLLISGGNKVGINNNVIISASEPTLAGNSITLRAEYTGLQPATLSVSTFHSFVAEIAGKSALAFENGQLFIHNNSSNFNNIFRQGPIGGPNKTFNIDLAPLATNLYTELYTDNNSHLILQKTLNKNVGIGDFSVTVPLSKLSLNGNLAIGNSYALYATAPANGAIIQGQVGIGTYTFGAYNPNRDNTQVRLQVGESNRKISFSDVPGNPTPYWQTSYIGFNVTADLVGGVPKWELDSDGGNQNAGSAIQNDSFGGLRFITIPTVGAGTASQTLSHADFTNQTRLYISPSGNVVIGGGGTNWGPTPQLTLGDLKAIPSIAIPTLVVSRNAGTKPYMLLSEISSGLDAAVGISSDGYAGIGTIGTMNGIILRLNGDYNSGLLNTVGGTHEAIKITYTNTFFQGTLFSKNDLNLGFSEVDSVNLIVTGDIIGMNGTSNGFWIKGQDVDQIDSAGWNKTDINILSGPDTAFDISGDININTRSVNTFIGNISINPGVLSLNGTSSGQVYVIGGESNSYLTDAGNVNITGGKLTNPTISHNAGSVVIYSGEHTTGVRDGNILINSRRGNITADGNFITTTAENGLNLFSNNNDININAVAGQTIVSSLVAGNNYALLVDPVNSGKAIQALGEIKSSTIVRADVDFTTGTDTPGWTTLMVASNGAMISDSPVGGWNFNSGINGRIKYKILGKTAIIHGSFPNLVLTSGAVSFGFKLGLIPTLAPFNDGPNLIPVVANESISTGSGWISQAGQGEAGHLCSIRYNVNTRDGNGGLYTGWSVYLQRTAGGTLSAGVNTQLAFNITYELD